MSRSSSDTSKIILLGTGTPNPDPERSGPSVAIVVKNTAYLVDCGPGVIRRAAAAYRAGVEQLKVRNIKTAFITHLHSDHTAGYPDLILTPWVMNRDDPLVVYGPSGLQEMTRHILAAYQDDIRERINGLQPSNDRGYLVNAYEIEDGIVYKDANVSVEAFRVSHGTLESYGFKFITPDRAITISGDTAPFENMVERYYGSNVLIHEVYSLKGYEKYPDEWKTYHANYHTSTHKLAEVASEAKPGLLILYHQLFGHASEDELLEEVTSRYDGDVAFGRDLEVY
jgi:ribonuclease BN (tRNA processing enzyme)